MALYNESKASQNPRAEHPQIVNYVPQNNFSQIFLDLCLKHKITSDKKYSTPNSL